MPWIRSGYCCRCGECCKGDPWEDPEVATKHGARPNPAKHEGYCPLMLLHIGAPQGDTTCTCHDPPTQHSYYLEACAPWPTDPAQIADKKLCTYRFTWTD